MERRNLRPVDAVMYGLISKAIEKTVWEEGMKPIVASARQRLRKEHPQIETTVSHHASLLRPYFATDAEKHKLLQDCIDCVWHDIWNELKTWEGCIGATSLLPFGQMTLFEL